VRATHGTEETKVRRLATRHWSVVTGRLLRTKKRRFPGVARGFSGGLCEVTRQVEARSAGLEGCCAPGEGGEVASVREGAQVARHIARSVPSAAADDPLRRCAGYGAHL